MSMDLFCLSEERIRRILGEAMSQGGDFADLYAEYSRFNSLVMEEGILKTAISKTEKGVGIRVVKGEKTGYAYTENLTEESFLKIARTAAAIAGDRGSEGSWEVHPQKYPNHYVVDDPTTDVALDRKIAWITKANEYARAYSDKVHRVTLTLVDNQVNLLMADTRGRLVTDEQPMLRFGVTVIARDGDQIQSGRSGGGGRVGFSFMTDETVRGWAEKAAREAVLLLEAKQAPAGMMPVILGPGDSGILLHEAIGHPLEADFNRKGTSAYSGRIDEMVADPQCTIIDDGTVPNDRGSLNVDDELNPSQKTTLIENGRLRSYMYDEMSARYFDVDSSGNGRRESYKFQPIPRMRTTYMLPGEYDPDEIIRSTERGIFCKTFRGGQVDISTGNFIFVPSEAWLVEDGKVSHPVKNFSLIGNGPDVLSKVNMIGNDFRMSAGIWVCGKGQSVPVGVGLPTIKISEMTVGGQSS